MKRFFLLRKGRSFLLEKYDFSILSHDAPNDSEPGLFLGSAWVHRVLVSILLGMGIMALKSSPVWSIDL